MAIDHSDTPGWPAVATPVHTNPHKQNSCWRNRRWREQMNEKRRQRYRAAIVAGGNWIDAKRAASRAA